MTEKGTPFEIIGATIIWIKDTLTVVFEPQKVRSRQNETIYHNGIK